MHDTMTAILQKAWVDGFSTKSDFARRHATEIGYLASEGYLTTRVGKGMWGPSWHLTPKGTTALFENEEMT